MNSIEPVLLVCDKSLPCHTLPELNVMDVDRRLSSNFIAHIMSFNIYLVIKCIQPSSSSSSVDPLGSPGVLLGALCWSLPVTFFPRGPREFVICDVIISFLPLFEPCNSVIFLFSFWARPTTDGGLCLGFEFRRFPFHTYGPFVLRLHLQITALMWISYV